MYKYRDYSYIISLRMKVISNRWLIDTHNCISIGKTDQDLLVDIKHASFPEEYMRHLNKLEIVLYG